MFCPACGNQVAEGEDTRFCPRCGRDLASPAHPGAAPAVPPGQPPAPTQADGAYAAPPPPPPPPVYSAPTVHAQVPPGQPAYGPGYPPPGPVAPSPAGMFVRRVFTGRWEMPLLVALGPALTVLAAGLAIAAAAGAALPSGSIGMATRTRSALAVLIQGLGGNLTASETVSDEQSDFDDPSEGGDEFSDGGSDGGDEFSDGGSDGGDDYSDGGYDGSDIGYTTSGGGQSVTHHATLSVLPWTVTLVWVVVLVLGLRMMRRRQQAAAAAAAGAGAGTPAGMKAESAASAVRVALLGAAAVLGLGFAAEPRISGVHFTTAPFLAALWIFVLTLVTALLVLCRPSIVNWLSARPGAAAAYRVLGTTAIALLATVFVAGVVVFAIAAAHYHHLSGWGVAAAGLLLLNLGVSGLGLGWGAPFHAKEGGSEFASQQVSFGLGDLDHVWGGWSVAGTVAGGLGCALLIGVLAARRSRSRPEQFAVAGLFTVLLVILAVFSGAHSGGDSSGTLDHMKVGTQVLELFGYGLLWTFGGVFLGPYVWRLFGGPPVPAFGTGPGAVPAAPYPYGPAPYGGAYGPGTYGGASGAGTHEAGYAGPRPVAANPVPPGPVGSVPSQPGPPAAAYGPPQQPGPPAPAEPTVHDLGVVQPDRLRKQPPDHR